VASEQSGLNVRHETEWDFLIQNRMSGFFFLSLLIRDDDFLAAIVIEMDGSPLSFIEIGWP
jgi:hypothetical protein